MHQAAELDPSFGDNGRLILTSSHRRTFAYDMATGDDDSIFVALSCIDDVAVGALFGLAKLHPDGRIDQTFGAEGYSVHPAPGEAHGNGNSRTRGTRNSPPYALSQIAEEFGVVAKGIQPFVLPDGKILLRCTSGRPYDIPEPFLARFHANGSLDMSFGNEGTRIFVFEEHILLDANVISLDGELIVLAGRRYRRSDGKIDGVIIRLLEDGSADPSFGEAGILPAAFPGGVDENVQCAVIQGEKFILAGMNSLQALARRFLPNGEIDTTFGSQGTYYLPETEDPDTGPPYFVHVLPTADGGFIGLGTDPVPGTATSRDYGFVVGIDADGRANQDFGGGHPILTPAHLGTARLHGGMFDRSGKLVVAGTLGGTYAKGWLVGRYSSSGVPDESFGDRGFMYVVFGEPAYFNEIARGFTVQGTRGILLSGQVINATSNVSDAVVFRVPLA